MRMGLRAYFEVLIHDIEEANMDKMDKHVATLRAAVEYLTDHPELDIIEMEVCE